MPDPIPSCFRGGAAGGPPASTAAGPSLTTSVYETHLGLAALSWSRTVFGLSLRADLRFGGGGAAAVTEDNDDEEETYRFHVRPWLFWKRRGSKRFHLKDHRQHRTVEFSWDLTRARFPAGGGPEPSSRYFVAVAVDGEMLLVAGDLLEEAYRKSKAARGNSSNPTLISRREHVVLGDSGDGRSYKTMARFGGEEREISIDLGTKERERDVGMLLGVDGKRVLQVRRLRWKFRGSERVEVEGGAWIQVSWDLHNWLFQPKDEPPATASTAAAAAELGHAVFVFRFERVGGEEGHFGKEGFDGPARTVCCKGMGGYMRKNRNWSESSSGGGGEGKRSRRRKKSLLKTSSSSSSSSASSASSSTVMEWASAEEAALQSADGFSLLVYAWKS
ncbi:hypothetical protein COCNU_01G005480 [Cocos nucifera]|uniref:DUF868 family protein n=1 Tax=Cocos nucifera TaxID=13894 RepID=A0A8K0HUW8_COCNU|nr:hypothetical protein COCNU_01G005480 [Cocos nucifera]